MTTSDPLTTRATTYPKSSYEPSPDAQFGPSGDCGTKSGIWLVRALSSTKIALALALGVSAVAFMPAVAQAAPLSTTMAISSELFPSGTPVPGGLSGEIRVSPGWPATLTAPQYLYQPSTPSGTLGTVYELMFWNVDSRLIPTEKADFRVPFGDAAPSATAWYLPVCVVASSCSGGGTSAVTTWAFSLTTDKVLPGTPIESVTPASTWTPPSTSVSTATAVNIAAAGNLGPYSVATGGTVFSSWFVFGGSSTVTVSGLDLGVPAGESAYAIAFYNQYPGYHKPICIGYPHCI